MDTNRLRRLTEEARNQAEIERANAAEKERLALEREANKIIANLPAIVAREAASGRNNYQILNLRHTEMRYPPKEAFTVFGARHYSPNCLPNHARRVYDYCKDEGLNPRLEDKSIHVPAYDFYLMISW